MRARHKEREAEGKGEAWPPTSPRTPRPRPSSTASRPPPDPRPRTLLTSLTRHLHDFVRESTPEEWEAAIGFLTETGPPRADTRQEFILLPDVLGISMLVEAINGRGAEGATEPTVLGPFHLTGSPHRELGDTIDLVGAGEPCVVSGRATSIDGTPLPGARAHPRPRPGRPRRRPAPRPG